MSILFDATQTYNGVDATSHAIPITATTDNLLLIFANNYNGSNQNLNTPSGWTKLGESLSTQTRPAVFAKISDGTEGSTVSLTVGSGSTNFDCSAVSYSLNDWFGDLSGVDIASFVAQASSASITDVNPSTVTASWGAESNNLFITAGFAARANKPFTVKPSGYASFSDVSAGPDGSGFYCHTSVGYKVANSDSDDPSIFTAGTFQNMAAVTVVIRGQEVNQAPTLDTPQPDVTIQEGQTGNIDLGSNFSDPNAGDTLTFSISPDISLVTGFSFNTSTGVISYDGNQEAASAVEYTVTASDGELTADDTFNLTVIVPALTIDSISDTTPQPGDSIVITVSNKAGTITAGDYTITAQDATTVTVTVPDPTTFTLTGETYPTLPFEANVSIPLNDGVTTANAVIQIQVPTGDDYTEITSIASGGFYANDVGVTAGMFGYVYDVVGTPYYDTATGAYALGDGDSFKYRIYNGEWGSSATVAEGSDPEVVVSQIILRDVLRDVLKPILRGVFDD